MAVPSRQTPLRVCVTGAECSGKTSLATALAEHFGAPVVPEWGRDYFVRRAAEGHLRVEEADVLLVTAGQAACEDRFLAEHQDAPLLVMDTDVFTIAVWQERYLGTRCKVIDDVAQERWGAHPIDLYLMCWPDIPWEPDDIRSHEALRSDMHAHFLRRFEETGRRFVRVTGSVEERVAQSVQLVDALLR